MTTSPRYTRNKTEKYHKNIHKRGNVPVTYKPKEKYSVGPIMIGFFLFVVVGSSFLQLIQTTRQAGPPRAQ